MAHIVRDCLCNLSNTIASMRRIINAADATTTSQETYTHEHSGKQQSDLMKFIDDALERLDWEEKAATAIKWSRLYGGALGVMLINDGGGIDEPLDYQRIKSIEEIRIYERAAIYPESGGHYHINNVNNVYNAHTTFRVHESRCLLFSGNTVPKHTMQRLIDVIVAAKTSTEPPESQKKSVPSDTKPIDRDATLSDVQKEIAQNIKKLLRLDLDESAMLSLLETLGALNGLWVNEHELATNKTA
jgi:hypothetical protein